MSIMSLDSALHPTSVLRWLYIDFNGYFASVEQQLRPELRGKPIAVVPVETDATCAPAGRFAIRHVRYSQAGTIIFTSSLPNGD